MRTRPSRAAANQCALAAIDPAEGDRHRNFDREQVLQNLLQWRQGSVREVKTVAERRHAHTGVQGICPSSMRYELTITFWGRVGALAPCHAFSGNSQVEVEKTLVFHSLTWNSR